MAISTRDEQLEALRSAVNEYVDETTRRLREERAFLESVVANTAEAAVAKARISDEVAAITSVRKLVGLK